VKWSDLSAKVSALLIDGIILKFNLELGRMILPLTMDEEGATYYYEPQLSIPDRDALRDLLLVSVLVDRFFGLEATFLHLYWRDGIAFHVGVCSIDVTAMHTGEYWERCNAK